MKPKQSPGSPQKCLIVGPSWVGDMVMAQSLFMALKSQDPDLVIDVLAPAWSKPLLARMPEVREAIEMPLGHGKLGLGMRYRLARSLRAERYDRAILLPNSLKSALIPFWAKIPERTGYVGEQRWGLLNDIRRLDKSRLTMTVQRFIALGLPENSPLKESIPVPRLIITESDIDNALLRLGLEKPVQPILALSPGAEFGAAKCWPSEHYAAVARQKLQEGWVVWLFGSDKDRAVTDRISEALEGDCTNLAGETSLEEAMDLLSLATVVVSNDSGLMHVAAAVGCAVVAVYGSTDPGFTPPLSERSKVLSLNLECSPCFKRECPLGHLECLRELKPERVLQTIDELVG